MFVVGEVVMDAEVAPVFHAYVPPPVAVSVIVPPLQTVVAPLMDAAGAAPITTDVVAVAEQPFAFVTVTV